jgi:hypothetical protein
MADPCPRLNFQGIVEQRFACADYRNYLTFDGSWKNNQSRNTVTYVRDKAGVIRYATPGAPSEDNVALWNWVGSIKVC